MCGIIGFFNKRGRDNKNHWDVDVIFDTVMHWRRKGVDGIGMLVISDENWYVRKDFISQAEFLMKYGKEIENLVNNETTRAIIFHNRKASIGLVNEGGVHPFIGERYIVMHNGTFNRNLIDQFNYWDYKADSDTERLAAHLNRPEIVEQDPERAIKFIASKIFSQDGRLGILVIYDKNEDYLYILRTDERELVLNLDKNGFINRIWNDYMLAIRFDSNVQMLPHGNMLKIDPNNGEIVKIYNVINKKAKTVVQTPLNDDMPPDDWKNKKNIKRRRNGEVSIIKSDPFEVIASPSKEDISKYMR